MDWPTFLKAVNDGAYSNLIFGALVVVPVAVYSCGYALAECRRMWLDAGRDDVEDDYEVEDHEEEDHEGLTQAARAAEAVKAQPGTPPEGPARPSGHDTLRRHARDPSRPSCPRWDGLRAVRQRSVTA